MKVVGENKPLLNLELYESDGSIDFFFEITWPLYSFLDEIVGPLSVYVCALNRTFLLVD